MESNNNWKRFQQVSEIPITWSLVWMLIKKKLTKQSYQLTISFHYKEAGEVKLTGAQIEFGKGITL
jgi:hypothetical protein